MRVSKFLGSKWIVSVFALLIIVISIGVYYLFRRNFLSFSENTVIGENTSPTVSDFAELIPETDWYAFSCQIEDIYEKKITFGSLYTISVAKCKYTVDGKLMSVEIPLALANQNDEFMIYGFQPQQGTSTIGTGYYVQNILKKSGLEIGTVVSIGTNVITEKNINFPNVSFFLDSVNQFYESDGDISLFAKTGQPQYLPDKRTVFPIAIMYTTQQ